VITDDEHESLRLATMVEALCTVASLARALRRRTDGPDYIGTAIEGAAACALQQLLGRSCELSGRAARAIEARIRASLGHGDRATLGTYYTRALVDSARRRMVADRPHSLRG